MHAAFMLSPYPRSARAPSRPPDNLPCPHRHLGRSGAALIIVLLFLVMLTGMAIGLFVSVRSESTVASSYEAAMTSRLLSESATQIVQAQIADATRGLTTDGGVRAWASQPGAIRTWDDTGKAREIFKLYSSDSMVISGDSSKRMIEEIPPTWAEAEFREIYTNLNEPATSREGALVYPIVDPSVLLPGSGGAANSLVDGFAIVGTEQTAPMPARWLYVLKDGKLRAGTPQNGMVEIPDATAINPIIGRIAFWTDDESSKVNINTASEGSYWDTPRVYSREDFGNYQGTSSNVDVPGLALCQPAQREFQRYPGHPATTSLSPILAKLMARNGLAMPAAPRVSPEYYQFAPRIVPGGSDGGTVMPTAALMPDGDRLYASTDELMFSSVFSGGASGGGQRQPNASDSNAPKYLTISDLQKIRFFLTSSSSSPETTLFNQPRISMWPVHTNPVRRTPYDKLAVFCSSIKGKEFSITRSDARSMTTDATGRNLKLYQYLQAQTARNIPGYGGNFLAKYGTRGATGAVERDQILTSIVDYIRSTSLQDKSTGATPFTPIFSKSAGANLGAGEVLPIRFGNTQGFGRFYSISEVGLQFFGTRDGANKDGMQAMLVLEFATPQQGLGAMRCNLKYSVTGLDAIHVQYEGDTVWRPLEFAAGGTNYMERADLNTFHGRSVGGTEGPGQAFLKADGSKKDMVAGANNRNQYPFVTRAQVPFPGSTRPARFRFGNATGGPVDVLVTIADASNGAEVQRVRLQFPPGQFKVPGYHSTRPITTNTFDFVQVTDTMVSLEPAGIKGNAADAADDPTAGDIRMVEGLTEVPASRFRPHRSYSTSGVQWAHGFLSAVGEPYRGATNGKLANVTTYRQTQGNSIITRQPDVPSRVPTGVRRSDGGPGDWDTGFGDQKDGAHINKPDEGDAVFTDAQAGEIRRPYLLGFGNGFASVGQVYFSPNRQIPSALMLGSIPTGVQSFRPWQTLLFHPQPEDAGHPGKTSPPDHLIADLFWMPVIEPYAISQPFATSGKINMNYDIQPFTYIRRDTGLRAVMKSTKFLAIEGRLANAYKPLDPKNSAGFIPDQRVKIDMDQTLTAFETRFDRGEIFKSATEICEVPLIPEGTKAASIAAFWTARNLTGDNVREKPYADLYPRLTTKSNAFTVHFHVQSLKKVRGTNPTLWDPAKDQVLSDHRGSTLIERYVDVNDPRLPDFAVGQESIDPYYKFRVIHTRRFQP